MASALAAGSLLLTGTAFGAPGDILFQTEFNTPGDLEGWTDSGNRLVGFDGTGEEAVITNGDGLGVLAAQISSGDPQLAQSGLSIDNTLVGKVVARVRKSDGLGGWISPVTDPDLIDADLILFSGAGGNQGGPDSKTADETVAGDGWTLVEWDTDNLFGSTITSIRWDPFNSGVGDAFEIDYFRFIETDAPPLTVERDPGPPIPAGFNLIQEWDTAAQLGDLAFNNLSPTAGGSPGVTIGPCTHNASEDCIFGVSLNADPQFITPGGLAIPLATDEQLIVEIGFVTDADFGTSDSELFWSDASGGFASARRIPFAAFPADDALHVLRITWANGSINTQLNQLRYDPVRALDLDAELDYIRIYTDTPLPTELFWDTDTVTAADQGGTGAWNTSNSFWYTGSSNVSWPSSPTGDDNAAFGGTAGTVTIDAGGITAHSLTFTTDGYTVEGGDLTLDSSLTDAFFELDGGAVNATVSADVVGDDDDARKTGAGGLTLSGTSTFNSFTGAGGTVTIPSGAGLTTLGANPSENNFAFKITGGTTVNIDGTIVADTGEFGGFSGDANFVVNINAGADLTLDDAIAGWNANVTYNFNGGTTSAAGILRHLDSGSATINVSGGTHTFGGELGAICNGNNSNSVFTITGGTFSAGTVQFNAGTAGNTATNSYTVNLDGGILETGRVALRRGSAGTGGDNTLNVKFNGGTLRALPGSAFDALVDGDTGEALGVVTFNSTVETGGAVIDTNGECKSIGNPLVVGAASGGGLTKQGTGNLYLNAANTYDGGTSVTAGNLGGSGSVVGDVTVSAGAGLAYFVTDPGAPFGGLTIGGDLTVPDPLVISIDSGGAAPFPETSVTGLVVADASSVLGFNLANVTVDTSKFTGLGNWTVSQSGGQILLDYTAGSSPFATYMNGFFPGETDPAIVGPNADPDHDGRSNIEEFGYGGNPGDPTDRGPRAVGVNDITGSDFLTLTVAVRSGASFSGGVDALTATQDGVDYTIDGSTGLLTFDSLVSEVTPAITTGLPGSPPAGYEYKTFQLNPDVSAGLGFLRYRAAEN